jgi:probable H4MPT-linked C1 transfer pathway protein
MHAVTMTAELSQMFRTKREGVAFVLDALERAFPGAALHVYSTAGVFVTPDAARLDPLAVAAANWMATAAMVAMMHPDAVLVDIGTTTADIVPIVDGRVAAVGRTDPERLASGELVYTGAVRTPLEAMISEVPYGDGCAAVSAEGFALAGDVHVWRGALAPADHAAPTPDGRPATREYARERLARVICADVEMLDDAAISAIADAAAAAQTARVAAAIARVAARHPHLRRAVVTGSGAFIAEAAARAAAMDIVPLARDLGEAAARSAPAAAVALLLESLRLGPAVRPQTTRSTVQRLPGTTTTAESRPADDIGPATSIDVVVKLGGGTMPHADAFAHALAAIADAAARTRLLVVPGGGLFADTVREADRRLGLSPDAAHWMAVLAMDQYAWVIADTLAGAVVVTNREEAGAALDAGRIPVLAVSRWLQRADPLPHSWNVTSDSIAAWIAGETGARRLVLIKPSGASGAAMVDAAFSAAVPKAIDVRIVTADHVSASDIA